MSWQKKSEHLDKRTGIHHVILHEPESGAEHHVQILVGHGVCHSCGAVHQVAKDGQLDIRARIDSILANLQASHDAMEEHAVKHQVPVLTADGSMRKARA